MKALRLFVICIAISFGTAITAQTVYTTEKGEKYHRSNCRYLKKSKKELELKRAKAFGYSACKVCKPIQNITAAKSKKSISTAKPKTKTKATAVQCTGKTKSGKRCKRKTKSINGRCYQH